MRAAPNDETRVKSDPLPSEIDSPTGYVAVFAPRPRVLLRKLRGCGERLVDAWRRCQVELMGDYSIERMHALQLYRSVVSPWRVMLLFFGTIVPCLLAIAILESFPLAPIESGIQHSQNFWYRTTIGTYMVTHSITTQFHHGIPELKITTLQIIFISATTTGLVMPVLYGMNVVIGYPMPFFVALSMIPWSPIVLAISWILFRDQVSHNPVIGAAFKKHTIIFNAQSLLIVVYPTYTYIFNSYPASQTWLAMFLPVLKLILKNLFGFASQHLQDAKPELVVFNVEIFSALYVSSCMQSASSLSTTILIMAVDFVQACMSIKDLYDVLDDPMLKSALGDEHGVTRKLIPLTLQIIRVNPAICEHPSIQFKTSVPVTPSVEIRASPERHEVRELSTRRSSIVPTDAEPKLEQLRKPVPDLRRMLTPRIRSRGSLLYNVDTLHMLKARPEAAGDEMCSLATRLTEQEQLLVVQRTLRILHIAEFIALIEYAEVFVPIVYSLFCIIAYTFPNGKYYSTFGALSGSEFVHTLANVMLYGSLELVSFAGFDYIMRRKFQLSAFLQTSFVLETQWGMVQSKLTLWMLIVLQFALQHYGSDFSFRFEWLQH